jgi:hypothetical protein
MLVTMPKPERTKQRTAKNLDSQFRSLYERVAHKLYVDPSYVSRVARGECESKAVVDALRSELTKMAHRIEKR